MSVRTSLVYLHCTVYALAHMSRYPAGPDRAVDIGGEVQTALNT